MNGGARVRQAQFADLARLIELERECDGAPHWSEAVWSDVLQGGAVERVVWVVEQERVTGFVVVSLVADVAEVESLGVSMEMRRQGAARALCVQAIRWAQSHEAVAIVLEVRASNVAALRLYAGLGFIEQGRRTRYYREPVEDAVMMRRELADVSPQA